MRKFLLLLLAAAPLWGQAPTITNLQATLGDGGSVVLRWVTSITSGDAARCYFDSDSNLSDATERTPQVNSAAANSGRRQCTIYTGPDSGALYVGPQSSDAAKTSWSALDFCTGACTNCGSGDNPVFADGSGMDCPGASQSPSVTVTVANSSPEPDAPASTALVTPPAVTGATYAVSSGCADISTKHDSAETDAEAGGDVVDMTLPAGEECPVSSFQLRNLSSGKIIVRSSADSKLLPPPGAQTSRVYKATGAMAKLTYSSMAALGDPLITVATGANGYYFENVEIGYPDLNSSILTPCTMTITGINTSTDTITVDDASCLAATASGQMVVVNLAGTGVTGGYGPLQVGTVTANAFKLYYGCKDKGFCGTSQGTLVDLKGAYGSGGTVRRWIVLPISAIADCGDGEACLTVTGHGIGNYPDMTITSGTGATIAVTGTPADYQIGNSADGSVNAHVVHVEGTSGANCDGLWVATVSGSNITLTRTGDTADCGSVSTGTVHGHRAMSVFKTSSNTFGDNVPQSWNVEAEDANTLRLLESTYAAASGGYVFWEVEPLGQIIDIGGSSSTRPATITFDRMLSDTCFPWNEYTWMAMNVTDDVALINSYQTSCYYRHINPVNTSVANAKERSGGYSQAHATINLQRSDGAIIRNNTFGPYPFLFSDTAQDSSYSTQQFTNGTINENHFWSPQWANEGNTADFRNHFLHTSFTPMEFKSMGGPVEIVGNYMKEPGKSNFQATLAAITLSLSGSSSNGPNGPHDVRIDKNVMDRGNTFVALTTTELDANRLWNPTERISIQGNLIHGTDVVTYGGSQTAGYFLTTSSGFRGMIIANNTYMPERCVMCPWMHFYSRYGVGLTYQNNIGLGSAGSNENRMGIFIQLTSPNFADLPTATADGGLTGLQGILRRNQASDLGNGSSFSNVIGIPGIKTSSSETYAVKVASTSASHAYCVNSIKDLNRFDGLDGAGLTWIGDAATCASTLPETVQARINTAFDAAVWTPSATYTGKGADLADIADAMGFCGPVTVTADDDQFNLAFHAPSTEEVYVTYVAWTTDFATTMAALSGGTRALTADGATQSKTFTAGTLSAETQYLYTIAGGASGGGCRKPIWGQVTTAGTP